MTIQMYVITASGGSYDDAWERAEFVTDDETKGEEYVASQNKLSEEVKAANEQIEKNMQHWRKVNPCPPQLPYEELAVPSFEGIKQKDITPAMRTERDTIRAHNNKMLTISIKPSNDWYTTQYNVKLAYIAATFRPEVVNGIEHGYHDTGWTIEPIAWLP